MLEKIKTVVKYIVFPLVLVFGIIFYLVQKLNEARQALGQAKADKQLAEILSKKEEASKDANEAEKRYLDMLRAYRDDTDKPGSA